MNDQSRILQNLGIDSSTSASKELCAILRNIQDVYCRTDNDGAIVMLSDSVTNLLGYTLEELLGTKLSRLYVEHDGREKFIAALDNADGRIFGYETALKHKDGSDVWVSTNAHYHYDENNNIAGIEGTSRDITQQKKQQNTLARLSCVLDQTADIIVVTNAKGIIEYVNPAYEKITGYSHAESLGQKARLLSAGHHAPEFYVHMWDTLLSSNVYRNLIVNKRKDGSLFHAEITISPLKDEKDTITHFIATAKDISDHLEDKIRLQHLAHHDPLTDLPNRTLFMDRLHQAITKAHHHKRLVAVMFIDLDRFKNINDTLGHNAGDNLLRQLSKRISKTIREGDTLARFGGDEFAILLDDFDSDNSVSIIAQKVLDCLASSFEVSGHEIFITASIGISIYPHDGEDADTLIRNADIAMYRAKELGKNNFQFYSESMTARVFERLTLENNLRHALERNEFVLYYQPQVDARSGNIIGVEALLRWEHPDLGLVTPNNFIPLLEETGLIEPVGFWVLETACRQSWEWHKAGFGYVHMSVNLSSRQFNNQQFIANLRDIIASTDVNPEFLELELTESMLMRNASATINALKALNDLGVTFAIDDFGTGYSSLTYLRRFPIDTIKIDRSFIRDITHDTDDMAICSAIIGMGQSLSLNVVAEGVETEGQLNFLRTRQCHYIQGNLFSHPVPANTMSQMLMIQHGT